MSKKSKKPVSLASGLNSLEASQWTFADIIAPITPKEFFNDYFGKKHLHIPGAADKFSKVMSWDILSNLLNMNTIWSAESLMLAKDRKVLPAHEYCQPAMDRSGNNVMMPQIEKVQEKIKEGATLVCNEIDSLGTGLRAISNALEKATNGKSQANLYCSSRQRQAFQSHYDTHDVFAMHMEGEKIWRIFKTLENFPIRHPAYQKSNPKMMEDRGDLLEEITLKPGDFLYIPRGQYHDALSSSEGCIHIAFGLTGYIGMDVIQNISAALVHNPLIRQNLPRTALGRNELKSHLKKVAQSITETITGDQFLDATLNQIDNFHYERSSVGLPVKADDIQFSITSDQLSIVTDQGRTLLKNGSQGLPIPPQLIDQVSWIVKKSTFNRTQFTEKFGELGIENLDKTLIDLENMKVIRKS